jgi:hypothetical protein
MSLTIKIKKMKSTLFIISIIYFLNVFCSNTSTVNLKNKKMPPPHTALDSLQGKWKWVLDTDRTCIVTGKTFTDIYVSSDTSYNYTSNETFKIYFSDTVVDFHRDFTFAEVSVDTTKTTGNYLVLVSQNDSTINCYNFGNVYYYNTDTFFTITDVFAKRKTIVFQKTQ